MSSLESVYCIFQFFGESPQFAVVEEHTCYICIECSDFDCVADFSAVKNVMQKYLISARNISFRQDDVFNSYVTASWSRSLVYVNIAHAQIKDKRSVC